VAGETFDEGEMLARFDKFLEEHGEEIGVLLVEPQWGSSQVGLPWPRDLLKAYITKAQDRGILVLADEIMCGLGRHGQGTLFLSEAWDLNPDAVTFGKAIGGGVYPLSGAVIKTGGALLGSNGRTVMQSHTFAGSSARALMTGTEVLRTLPLYFDSIKKLGDEMKVIFRHLEKISNGLIYLQGQGLMWGALVSRSGIHKDESTRRRTVACLKENLEQMGVIPYFVPVGGFMVSPVIDIDVGTLYTIAERMEKALVATVEEVNWDQPVVTDTEVEVRVTLQLDEEFCVSEVNKKCLSNLHFSRTCTSCESFVRPELRRRFSQGLLELQSFARIIESQVLLGTDV
jgi:adenosylmethionine-8-amino-7-oxononanoate aminotransferase